MLWEEELAIFCAQGRFSGVCPLCYCCTSRWEGKNEILKASFMMFVFLLFPPHYSVECESV
jgi:hypothetical protein